MKPHVRWMIHRDRMEVEEIEARSFEFPWQPEDFTRCLRQRNCIGMVAEYDEEVVGFMIYELHKSRLHVLNFAVSPEFRRMGIGRAMIVVLVEKIVGRQGRNRIVLEIRETNLAAQLFFRQCGFRATSIQREFFDNSEDAYTMQYRLMQVPSERLEPVA